MATRRPLALVGGVPAEIPSGDTMPIAVLAAEVALTVTYSNSWADVGAPTAFAAVKDRDGWVTLSGFVGSGVSSDGTTMFTLPVGSRPTNTYEPFAVWAQSGLAVVRVNSTGAVTLFGAAGSSFVSLSGVRFKGV